MVAAGVADEAIRWMTMLNKDAAELMLECGANSATDVTGFGLIGHACEMAVAAGVTIRLELDKVPVMAAVAGLIGDGLVPAGCYRNRDHYARFVASGRGGGDELLPLFDPQTSGGLLISLPPAAAELFQTRAAAMGLFAVSIGCVLARREAPLAIV